MTPDDFSNVKSTAICISSSFKVTPDDAPLSVEVVSLQELL